MLEGARDDQRLERRSPDQLHRQKETLGALTSLVERDDVGVLDRCLREPFAAEPLIEGRVEREVRGEHLECDLAVDRHLGRLVDHAHAALPEHAFHDVPVNPGAGWQHRGHPTRSVVGGRGFAPCPLTGWVVLRDLSLELRQVRAHGGPELVRERRERSDGLIHLGGQRAQVGGAWARTALRTARTKSSERSRNSRAAARSMTS